MDTPYLPIFSIFQKIMAVLLQEIILLLSG